MRRKLLVAFTIVPGFAVTLAGCTSTVDRASAENVIKTQIGKLGPLVAKSVSCPDNVKKKDGVSFACKVTLRNTANGATAMGTITLHITGGGNRAMFSGSDIHVQ